MRSADYKGIGIKGWLSGRRLAAIMFTDMVGFTSLTQKNEPLTLELLEEHRRLLRPLFPKYGGKEIKTEGDKFLVEFASALDAVRCALEIQQTLHESNTARQPEKRVILRVGVHLGDIIHTKDRDVYGDAVNVASRIEPLADPGGVCISDQVYAQIKNKIEYPIVRIGSKQLKNVQEPMEVYKVELPWREEKGPAQEVPLERNRLVVLPFKSMSPDPNDEYFADGMTEELITALSSIKGIDVIARTTAMHYKGGSKRISDIGKELSCRSLIEGSVRKAGDRVRISVQLVRAQDEAHIWAQNYNKQLDDIFAIQSDIGKRVARALKVKLMTPGSQEREKGVTPNSGAYTLYLKGMSLLNSIRKEALNEAIDCFEKTVEIDPSFALGFSGLAACHYSRAALYPDDRTSEYKKAKTFALKALEMDDKIVEAHVILAQDLWRINYDLRQGEEELRKAIELEPSCVDAHIEYAALLLFQKRTDEAFKECMRVVDLDPLSPWTAITLGVYFSATRAYDKAIEQYKKAVQAAPNDLLFRFLLFRIYFLAHMPNEALRDRDLKPIAQLKANSPESKAALLLMYSYMGEIQKARGLLSSLDPKDEQYLRRLPFFLGIAHIQINDVDEGFEWLERAVDDHDRGVTLFLSNCEELDGVRGDPRYHALLRRVNLE